jgi:hypothetical protein
MPVDQRSPSILKEEETTMIILSERFDDMTDDELRSLSPEVVGTFVKTLIDLPEVIRADMSPGELRLFQIINVAIMLVVSDRERVSAKERTFDRDERTTALSVKLFGPSGFEIGKFPLRIPNLIVENIGYTVVYQLNDDPSFNCETIDKKGHL